MERPGRPEPDEMSDDFDNEAFADSDATLKAKAKAKATAKAKAKAANGQADVPTSRDEDGLRRARSLIDGEGWQGSKEAEFALHEATVLALVDLAETIRERTRARPRP